MVANAGAEGGERVPELLRNGEVITPVEVATSTRDRTRGLLGRDRLEGALLLSPASSVHTLGMRFPIDVAFCDRRMRVLVTVSMRPNRVGLPRPRSRHVIEAEAGQFARWGLRKGDQLDVRGSISQPPRLPRGGQLAGRCPTQ
ncbi:MAG TPA: DUF192 domain-containing protein [Actinomycetota bacterium]|nr:DUF192 domain-containing protein [Actinomycetota bacterium]